MIFNFLKYIHPTWYYNLKPKTDYSYFPTQEILEREGFSIKRDLNYISNIAQERDLAWRAFQQGYISSKAENGIDVWNAVKMPIKDEYRFFRKNFHKLWTIYVLVFRIVTLHNPFKELSAFLNTRNVQRESHANNTFTYPNYEIFQSPLIIQQPFVSVIIPTLNRYEYLKDVFKDLENQTYKNFEVIVVDQTENFNAAFYKGWDLDIKFWYQEEKALWKARNEAIKSAKGTFILMSEDDIRIPKNLIENHLKAIDFFKADVSCGVFFPEGSSIPKERSYFKYGEQFATGNALLRRALFEEVGLYDRQFEKQRMGDAEFGLRLYKLGYKLVSNPIAYCVDVKAPEGGLRIAGGSWDALRPKDFFAARPVPSVLYLYRKYFDNTNALNEGLRMAFYSYIPYKHKGNNRMRILYMFMTFFLLSPVVGFTFYKSWRRASAMLGGESRIEQLKN